MNPVSPLEGRFTDAVAHAIEEFLSRQRDLLTSIDPTLSPVCDAAASMTSGGKRVRPAFCYWGFRAVAEVADEPALLRAAASLDMLHASALVHDDLIDHSDTRRGLPSVHKVFGADGGDDFGAAMAILVGDMLVMWSAEMFDACGLEISARSRALLATMRTEVTAGQVLDVVGSYDRDPSDARRVAQHIVDYKTTRYTVMRPVQIGAALAGADEATLEALGAFAIPAGRAFQYRDDILGVFGDPAKTGKPSGDDLREGKKTILVAEAFERLTGARRRKFAGFWGDQLLDDDGLDASRTLLEECGARSRVEEEIERNLDEAQQALAAADLNPEASTALATLATIAARRDA